MASSAAGGVVGLTLCDDEPEEPHAIGASSSQPTVPAVSRGPERRRPTERARHERWWQRGRVGEEGGEVAWPRGLELARPDARRVAELQRCALALARHRLVAVQGGRAQRLSGADEKKRRVRRRFEPADHAPRVEVHR